MVKLIAFSAPAGAGKDTASDHLARQYGFRKMSLADPMKRIVQEVYGFTNEQLWGPSQMRNAPDKRYPRKWLHKLHNGGDLFTGASTQKLIPAEEIEYTEPVEFLSPRIALQLLGSEWGRVCYQDTWVDMTLRNAAACPYPVVIPDCRFQNEINAIHKAGGKVIRLRRQTQVDALTVGVQGHVSEAEQLAIPDSQFDKVLEVENGLERFYNQLDALMKEL